MQKAQRRPVAGGRNEVRIIGGAWRGRKVRFPPVPGLRPSPDRVRETLFNWLAPVVRGARCLDLFAGSGVLGLEALSRGAAAAVLVDRDRTVTDHLRSVAAQLGAEGATVVQAAAESWLEQQAGPFDLVFLDPPFRSGALPGLLRSLDRPGWLSPGAFVYIECAAEEGPPALPQGWTLHRQGRAGDVGYYLAIKSRESARERRADPAAGARGGSTR